MNIDGGKGEGKKKETGQKYRYRKIVSLDHERRSKSILHHCLFVLSPVSVLSRCEA